MLILSKYTIDSRIFQLCCKKSFLLYDLRLSHFYVLCVQQPHYTPIVSLVPKLLHALCGEELGYEATTSIIGHTISLDCVL